MADGWVKVWWVRPDLDLKRFVDMPRLWNPKTSVTIAVRMALLWPAEPATVPEYIRGQLGPEESALKPVVIDHITRLIEEQVASNWQVSMEEFGANLPR